MLPARLLRGLALGALGAALCWLMVEPIDYLTNDRVQQVDWNATVILGVILGGCIGAALGVAEGIVAGTASKFKRALAMGAAIGAVGGCMGLWLGQALYSG